MYVNTYEFELKTEEDYQAQLEELNSLKSELEEQLEKLELALADVEDISNDINNRETSSNSVENDLAGLGDTIDDQYEIEISESHEFQDKIIEKSSKTTVEKVSAQVTNTTSILNDYIEESYDSIEDLLAETEATLNARIDLLKGDIDALELEIGSQAEADTSTSTTEATTDETTEETSDTTTEETTEETTASDTETSQ